MGLLRALRGAAVIFLGICLLSFYGIGITDWLVSLLGIQAIFVDIFVLILAFALIIYGAALIKRR